MPPPGWDTVSYYQNIDMGRFVILLIIVSGIVAVRDLSDVIDGYNHIASPGFQVLKDCTRFRLMYGWLGLIFHGICLLAISAFMVIAVLRLFNALSRPGAAWTCGAACLLLLLSLPASRLIIRSKGSDQVEMLMKEKWREEKQFAPEHDEEVNLYRSAILCNRSIPFIIWHLIGILGAGLILYFTL